jgi:hypothetical protein
LNHLTEIHTRKKKNAFQREELQNGIYRLLPAFDFALTRMNTIHASKKYREHKKNPDRQVGLT